MLVNLRNGEGAEEHHEDEDGVDRERLLDQIAGKKLERLFASETLEDPAVEEEGQRDMGASKGFRQQPAITVDER